MSKIDKIPVNKIVVSQLNCRQDFACSKLAELTASIKNNGLLQPITVRRLSVGDGQYELVLGERRLRAALEIGLEEVDCIVVDWGDQQALEAVLAENVEREDLNILEEGEGIINLINAGGSIASCSTALGKKEDWVQARLFACQSLGDDARDQIRNKEPKWSTQILNHLRNLEVEHQLTAEQTVLDWDSGVVGSTADILFETQVRDPIKEAKQWAKRREEVEAMVAARYPQRRMLVLKDWPARVDYFLGGAAKAYCEANEPACIAKHGEEGRVITAGDVCEIADLDIYVVPWTRYGGPEDAEIRYLVNKNKLKQAVDLLIKSEPNLYGALDAAGKAKGDSSRGQGDSVSSDDDFWECMVSVAVDSQGNIDHKIERLTLGLADEKDTSQLIVLRNALMAAVADLTKQAKIDSLLNSY